MLIMVSHNRGVTMGNSVYGEGEHITDKELERIKNFTPLTINEQKARWNEVLYVNPATPEGEAFLEYADITPLVAACYEDYKAMMADEEDAAKMEVSQIDDGNMQDPSNTPDEDDVEIEEKPKPKAKRKPRVKASAKASAKKSK